MARGAPGAPRTVERPRRAGSAAGRLGPALSALTIAAGLGWLALGAAASWPGVLAALLPGGVLLVAGVSAALWPRDRRPLHFAAGAALIGCVVAPFSLGALGLAAAAVLLLGSAALYLLIGRAALDELVPVDGVPAIQPGVGLAAAAAFDDVILASLHLRFRLPDDPDRVAEIARELDGVLALSRDRGWDADPAGYHRRPEPPASVELTPKRLLGRRFEHLEFDSGFTLWPGEPPRPGFPSPAANGEPRSGRANLRAHAWVVRHQDATRPWLIAISGFRLGQAPRDLMIFPPRLYHERLGLNLAIYVLPLHGPRKLGRHSGEGFLDGDPLYARYAQAQAVWDLRRLCAWIRCQGAARVGVLGVSLGAHSAALLASLEELHFVIAGTPPVDLARIYEAHGPESVLRRLETAGVTADRIERLLWPVSPLALPPRVPHAGRFIYAGLADRVVSSDHARDLFEHWGRPRMWWYAGGHIPRASAAWRATAGALREAEILDGRQGTR